MNIEFSPRADENLQAIRDYIAETSEIYADRTIARILQSIAMLEHFPFIGRAGIVEGTRELVIVGLPYIAIYEFPDETTVRIIRILHSRRKYP